LTIKFKGHTPKKRIPYSSILGPYYPNVPPYSPKYKIPSQTNGVAENLCKIYKHVTCWVCWPITICLN